jgi:hypothetical protein
MLSVRFALSGYRDDDRGSTSMSLGTWHRQNCRGSGTAIAHGNSPACRPDLDAKAGPRHAGCEFGGGWLCPTWPKGHAISVVWRRILSLTHIHAHKSSSPHGKFDIVLVGHSVGSRAMLWSATAQRLRGKNRPWLRAFNRPPNDSQATFVCKRPPACLLELPQPRVQGTTPSDPLPQKTSLPVAWVRPIRRRACGCREGIPGPALSLVGTGPPASLYPSGFPYSP